MKHKNSYYYYAGKFCFSHKIQSYTVVVMTLIQQETNILTTGRN